MTTHAYSALSTLPFLLYCFPKRFNLAVGERIIPGESFSQDCADVRRVGVVNLKFMLDKFIYHLFSSFHAVI